MIKDDKFVSTDFPQYEIHWGMLQGADEVKIKEWLTENIINLCVNINLNIKDTTLCHSYIDTLVRDIYDNIHQVGYDEGYDSAQCDNEGEGL